MRVGSSKMAIFDSFAGYIFTTFTFKPLLYVISWWLFIDTEIFDLDWPFCVKVCIEIRSACQLMGLLWAAKTAKIQLLLTNQSSRESINHFTLPINQLVKLINLPNN